MTSKAAAAKGNLMESILESVALLKLSSFCPRHWAASRIAVLSDVDRDSGRYQCLFHLGDAM